MPVEHSGGSGGPLRDVYPGDPDGFERWMELDVDEGGLAKSGGAMCSAIAWWGRWGLGGFKSKISNNWATGEALDRTKVHTFGASYDPVKRQVTSWVDGKQKWQTPIDCSSVPTIAAQQHFYPILSVWRIDKGMHKSYSMHVSGVRAYVPPHAPIRAKSVGGAKADTATARYDWCVVTYRQGMRNEALLAADHQDGALNLLEPFLERPIYRLSGVLGIASENQAGGDQQSRGQKAVQGSSVSRASLTACCSSSATPLRLGK
jgi:hypothetical protein